MDNDRTSLSIIHFSFFILHSSFVFEFKEVKTEMDYIRGKTTSRGKISAKAFLEGVINILR